MLQTRSVACRRGVAYGDAVVSSATSTNELRALGRLAFDEVGAVPTGIGQIHRGIARRAFWAVGPLGRPVEVAHEAMSRRVYGALGAGGALLGRAADAAMARRHVGEDLVLSTTRRGSAVLAALNGLIGDELERRGSELHQPAAVRVEGEPVPLHPESLRAHFPDATPWPVVFVHGLMETEFSWSFAAGPGGETYGSRLARDLGCTPVYVRYNSGRHVSENGRSLADLLASLVAAWPVEVDRIALVGHSMGGLVARSACHHAAEAGHAWPARVRHVVSLGTPHMGAPLEQAVHVASAALNTLPETRPFGAFLRRRSAGIRDLRQGSLVDEDWRDCDPDALRAAACREVPLLEGATHCFVSACVTRSPRHPVGRLVGDCLVLVPSASGRSRRRRIPFRDEHGAHVAPAHHFALLNHPQVYVRLRGWLADE
jgi:pimeloyl-ACP methyl ester carboxylesterase